MKNITRAIAVFMACCAFRSYAGISFGAEILQGRLTDDVWGILGKHSCRWTDEGPFDEYVEIDGVKYPDVNIDADSSDAQYNWFMKAISGWAPSEGQKLWIPVVSDKVLKKGDITPVAVGGTLPSSLVNLKVMTDAELYSVLKSVGIHQHWLVFFPENGQNAKRLWIQVGVRQGEIPSVQVAVDVSKRPAAGKWSNMTMTEYAAQYGADFRGKLQVYPCPWFCVGIKETGELFPTPIYEDALDRAWVKESYAATKALADAWVDAVEIIEELGGGEDASEAILCTTPWSISAKEAGAVELVVWPSELQGGTVSGNGVYKPGAKVSLKAVPAKGYGFAGWFSDKNHTKPIASGTDYLKESIKYTVGKKNVALYAKFVKGGAKYTVKFNANGGTGTMKDLDLKIGATKALTKNAFKRTGYTFQGWATKKNGKVAYKNKAKVKNLSTKIGATVTLYAVWKANTYKIAFDKNGGKGTAPKTVTATYGKDMKLPACKLTRAKYTFKGWSTSKKATTAQYKDKAKVKNVAASGTVKLYAVWAPDQYTLILDPNGATGAKTKKAVNCGDKVKLTNSFKRDGFTFKGWATKKNGKVVYANGKSVKDLAKKGKSVTLYAVWSLPDWAFGEFNGWCGYWSGKWYYDGIVTATVSSLGELKGTLTFEGKNGGTDKVNFSADRFSEYEAKLPVYDFLEFTNYDDASDEEGLVEEIESGAMSGTVAVYVYANVQLKLPDSTTRTVDIVFASWRYDGKGLRGVVVMTYLDSFECMAHQNLFKSKHLALPAFDGKPTVELPVTVYEEHETGITKMNATFASSGVITIDAYKGTAKQWSVSTPMSLFSFVDGVCNGGTDFMTPNGWNLWFNFDLKPGKNGKVSAKGITIDHDDD